MIGRSKIKTKYSEGACQKTTLGCCVEDTYRVLRGGVGVVPIV